MNIKIKNSSNDPIYFQIKKQIQNAILSGELESGEPLPSIRFLAKELRISVITTKRAYDELENDGYIHSVQGKGSFIAMQNRNLLRERLLKKIETNVREILHDAKLADISYAELLNIIKVLEEEEDEKRS